MHKLLFAGLIILCAPLLGAGAAGQTEPERPPVAPLQERMRVFFESGSSAIAEKELATIRRAAQTAQKFDLLTIKVVGHADRQGTATDNVQLALDRATKVVSALKEAEVLATAIEAPVSRGAEEPLATAKRDLHLNRRVEISIYGIHRLESQGQQ